MLVKVASCCFNCSMNSLFWLNWDVTKVKDLFSIWVEVKLFHFVIDLLLENRAIDFWLVDFFFILTRFNTHYESMRDSIYCSERCASAALFSHQKPLLSVLYTITVFNARTLWVCFFFIFSLFHLTLQWHHSLKLIQYAHWEYHSNDHHRCTHDF